MRKRFGKYALALFLMGTFSLTQVKLIGSIGLAELFAFLAAPLFLVQDYDALRRHGFLPLVWLSIFVMVNCVVSIIDNDVYWENGIRGFATTYAMFAIPVVMHRFLSRDIWSLKWFLLGAACSGIINVFAMHTGTETHLAAEGGGAGGIVSGTLFWVSRLSAWLGLPTTGWYLQTPLVYSMFALPLMGVINMLTTDSGRSALLAMMFGSVMIFIGRKRQSSMRQFKKHFFAVVVILGVCGLMFKTGYTYLARNGYLNEKAQKKYEMQTRHGSGALQILMAGRMEFFCGLMANLKKPLTGYGPWAVDKYGIYEEYLFKYGEQEDIYDYLKMVREFGSPQQFIPAHSMIIGGWTWYGIMALFYWLYVLWLMFDVLKNYVWVVPEFFGYFAVTIPPLVWAILFSPFGDRMGRLTLVVMLLLVRGVAKGRVMLPIQQVYPQRKVSGRVA